MRPIRLTIENLRSFRTKTEFDFTGLNIFAIIGDTGVGKTSLLEAMTFALFNRPTFDGRSVRELVAQGRQSMSVEFRFAVGGDEFTVYRLSRRSGSQHRLTCSNRAIDVSGEAAVKTEVNKALQMDAETFLHTVLLPQGKHAALLTSQRGDRNRILEDLFHLQDLDKVRQRVEREDSNTDMALRTYRQMRESYGTVPAGAIERARSAISEIEVLHSRAIAAVQSVRDIDCEITGCHQKLGAATAGVEKLGSGVRILADLDSLSTVEAELEPLLAEQRQACEAARGAKETAQAEAAKLETKGKSVLALRKVETNLQQLLRDLEMVAEEQQRVARYEVTSAQEERTLCDLRNTIAAAADERKAIESKASSQRQRETELETQLEGLRSAIEAYTAATAKYEDQRKATAEKSEESRGLAAEEVDAAETCAEADTACKATQLRLSEMRKANQVAEISQHLHAGDECPVCLRSLPKEFSPKKSSDLRQATQQDETARKAFESAQATRNRFEALLEAATKQLNEMKPLLQVAETGMRRAERVLVNLARGDVDDPEKLLASMRAELENNRNQLATLTDELTRRDADLSVLAQKEATSLANSQNFDRERDACLKRIASYKKAFESRCGSLPQALQPKADAESIASVMSKVAKSMADAEANERQLHEANETLAGTTEATRRLEQRLSKEVREPRVQLIERLSGVAALAQYPEPPADERERLLWVAGVAQAVAVEITRLTELRAALETKVSELQTTRANTVAQIGGEPTAVSHGLAIRKNDAEHQLREIEQNVERTLALDAKINKLDGIHLGLSGVKEALQARNFRAYAAGQRQQSLLREATSILREMTKGRFEFAPDFQIFDLESNEARTSETLSGGEKFLASLALSLGVVEIAANAGSKIESLFLDEGFDALDANTLQLAMLELRRRAHQGRMICVISHVSQVTEFVNEAIVVTRGPDGSEYTRRSGPIDDDDAAVERLVSHLTAGATNLAQ